MASSSSTTQTNEPTITNANSPHAVRFTARLTRADLEFEIIIQIHLPWETDYDIFQYLVISRTARCDLLHHVAHIQELHPETVFVCHPTFSTPLAIGTGFKEQTIRQELFNRIHRHPLHVNKTTALV